MVCHQSSRLHNICSLCGANIQVTLGSLQKTGFSHWVHGFTLGHSPPSQGDATCMSPQLCCNWLRADVIQACDWLWSQRLPRNAVSRGFCYVTFLALMSRLSYCQIQFKFINFVKLFLLFFPFNSYCFQAHSMVWMTKSPHWFICKQTPYVIHCYCCVWIQFT